MEKMLDYTKFKLKPKEEITELIKDKDNFFVFECGKCYKEFVKIDEECGDLSSVICQQNKIIIGRQMIDFLCNRYHLEKKINQIKEDLDKSDNVLVFSCGIGVQTIGNLLETKPVYTVADTIPQEGQHGIALYDNKCDGCATCFLTITQGICPITNCCKELLNGPCGGAKNGKCEVSKDKDCGWEKIYERLQVTDYKSAQQPVQLRKYDKANFKILNKHNIAIREKRFQSFYGGIYPYENKEFTSTKPIQKFPEPETVIIPLSQHTGSMCELLVKVGDSVKVGQKLGDSGSFISAPIHSSISGKVTAIRMDSHPIMSIVIKSDGKNEHCESIKPNKNYENLTKEQLIDIIREKGIVGLSGAQFPTHVKLKSPKPIDTLILNGCECEPYLTADDRLMVERPEEIVLGMKLLMKILNVNKGYIGIETNKQESIKSVKSAVEKHGLSSKIEITELTTKYPQGCEKVLIKKVLKREIPIGGLPLDVGVVINNVGTAISVYNAVVNGLPLIERVITVTGERIKNKLNLQVKIGTLISEIIDYCGFDSSDKDYQLKIGGPMMGLEQNTFDIPVVKGTTCVLMRRLPAVATDLGRKCIKCGRCVDVCPMELYPLYYWYYKNSKNLSDDKARENYEKELKNIGFDILDNKGKHSITNCVECGCCEYICSSKLPLVNIIKNMKEEICC